MKKANTGLLSARMMENEQLIKNAIHYEKLLIDGNTPEKIISKAKDYLGLDENTPVTGFWEDIQKAYNVKTNTFIKAVSLLNSLKELEAIQPNSSLEVELNDVINSLAEVMCNIYDLEEDDLYEYELEEIK